MTKPCFCIGQVGYGRWGRTLARYFQPENGFQIKTIVVNDLAKPHPDLPPSAGLTDSLDAVLLDPSISAVIVATPWQTHFSVAEQVLAQGKHLFVEKPLAMTGAQAEALKTAAKEKGTKVLVDYTFTFSPSVIQMQALVAAGEIGALASIFLAMHQTMQPKRLALGPELTSHLLSLLALFVPLQEVDFARWDFLEPNLGPQIEILSFSRPLPGKIITTEGFFRKNRLLAVFGTQGSVIFNSSQSPSLVCKKGARVVCEYDYGEADNLRFAVARFYAMLSGENWTNLDEAISVTRALEQITSL